MTKSILATTALLLSIVLPVLALKEGDKLHVAGMNTAERAKIEAGLIQLSAIAAFHDYRKSTSFYPKETLVETGVINPMPFDDYGIGPHGLAWISLLEPKNEAKGFRVCQEISAEQDTGLQFASSTAIAEHLALLSASRGRIGCVSITIDNQVRTTFAY